MPVAGYVTIHYDSATSLSYSIHAGSRVHAKIVNPVKKDTSVTARLRLQSNLAHEWCQCTSSPQDCFPATLYRYERDTTHTASEWQFSLGGVLPNEIVALACSTIFPPTSQPIGMVMIGSGDPDTVGQTLVWRRSFWLGSDWDCTYRFRQEVYLSIVLSPDTVVRFASLDSNNVYPYYPAIRNDTVTAGVKKRYMDLEAKAAYGDSLLRDYFIKVEKPQLVDSGGHSHDSTRPLGTYRVAKVSGSGFDIIDSSFTRKTDSTGGVKFRYLASQFGGSERIKAKLVSDTTKTDTLTLTTRVPGLQLLPEGTNYVKVGGTCRHHGPSDRTDVADSCKQRDHNHNASQVVRDSLPLMVSVWVDTLGQDTLFINDISLPYGGLFDHKGSRNWQTPHSTHREGLDVDIRTAIPGERDGVEVRNAQGKWVGNDKFEKLCKKYGVKKPDGHDKGTGNEHYHLYYWEP
ncbi:MAG TPA: hypothetical protein VGB89_12800 [Bacteroidota bacterium]